MVWEWRREGSGREGLPACRGGMGVGGEEGGYRPAEEGCEGGGGLLACEGAQWKEVTGGRIVGS